MIGVTGTGGVIVCHGVVRFVTGTGVVMVWLVTGCQGVVTGCLGVVKFVTGTGVVGVRVQEVVKLVIGTGVV